MRLIYFLFLLLSLQACQPGPPKPPHDSSWMLRSYVDSPGIVMLATAWGQSELCTGNLISENVVLTAAHCLDFMASDIYVVYNCNKITDSDCKKIQALKIIKNPNYKRKAIYWHDLGIVVLPVSIRNRQIIQIYLSNKLIPGTRIRGAGFGKRNESSGTLYSGMATVEYDNFYEFITNSDGGRDPHHGDSGGPAYIIDSNGQLKLTGILSRVYEHNDKITGEAIYTKPQMYLEWINEVIKDNEL